MIDVLPGFAHRYDTQQLARRTSAHPLMRAPEAGYQVIGIYPFGMNPTIIRGK